MKSKAQKPTKKTKEQEMSKERNVRESNLQQNTNMPQNSSPVEQFRQIKTNWVQDPFDPVNIIQLTKTQILLYKKIGVKTNMKKHDEKK